jgi:hypothetical protein
MGPRAPHSLLGNGSSGHSKKAPRSANRAAPRQIGSATCNGGAARWPLRDDRQLGGPRSEVNGGIDYQAPLPGDNQRENTHPVSRAVPGITD